MQPGSDSSLSVSVAAASSGKDQLRKLLMWAVVTPASSEVQSCLPALTGHHQIDLSCVSLVLEAVCSAAFLFDSDTVLDSCPTWHCKVSQIAGHQSDRNDEQESDNNDLLQEKGPCTLPSHSLNRR